ncbi:GTP cyclohydrolase I [Elizabethkingia bruuniana]|uniref:GTP cyclohydrolase I n=2 Tax=Elizabethkingia TaxID=308865 RepID=A0A7T8A0D9_9FLAO|nr:GTP cyclohydrolase I [Elizabethkingia anophelis]QDZ64640.1 hypothetical protein EVD20_04330 [Elizabethkingia bruuniana]MCT4071387.1 GTP cyclohydrolase I [Elizabethkingia anophelis]MCT4193619.1 GTP cyclohydrolase I [Elizabethkingia anophelis]MDV2458263.1 hypothetical protein [Elizabethkingia anophelis]
MNRSVQCYAKRPQVQERLTIQISEALKEILHHDDVAVVIIFGDLIPHVFHQIHVIL